MPGATLGTYNCLYTSTPAEVATDVQRLAGLASVWVLTEARSAGVDAALASLGWRQFRHPRESSDRIVWDPDIWGALDVFGDEQVHAAGPGKHLPARHVTWQGLLHKGSATHHVVVASHVTAGYAAGDPHQVWRDWAARQHLLGIVGRTAQLAQRGDLDFHHLGGDLNATRDKDAEWWYPVNVLHSLYVPDQRVAGVDYLAHTRLSQDRGLEVVSRWTVTEGLHSDHPAHLKRVRFPRLVAQPDN